MNWPHVNDVVYFAEKGRVHQGIVQSRFVVPGKITVNYVNNYTHEPTNISLEPESLFHDRESAKASAKPKWLPTDEYGPKPARELRLQDLTITVIELGQNEYQVISNHALQGLPYASKTIHAASMRDAQMSILKEMHDILKKRRDHYDDLLENIETEMEIL